MKSNILLLALLIAAVFPFSPDSTQGNENMTIRDLRKAKVVKVVECEPIRKEEPRTTETKQKRPIRILLRKLK